VKWKFNAAILNARAIIEWLAERVPDDPALEFGASLRASFLARQKIRARLDSEL